MTKGSQADASRLGSTHTRGSASRQAHELAQKVTAAIARHPVWLPVGMTAGLLLAALWMFPSFDSLTHLSNMTRLVGFVALVAFGQTFVILLGGIDLSVPWVLTAGGVLAAQWGAGPHHLPLGLALVAVLAVAAAIGVFNGAIIAWLGLSPIIVTLATNGLVTGALLAYEKGAAPGHTASAVTAVVAGKFLGISVVGIGVIMLTLLLVWVAKRTLWGFRLTATGGNLRASQISGVRTRAVIITSYMVCSLCAALAGILFGGFVQQPYYGMGDPYLFEGIAAAVIGGAALSGGVGGFTGTLAGVALLVTLDQFMSALSVSAGVVSVIYGVVILMALLITSSPPRTD